VQHWKRKIGWLLLAQLRDQDDEAIDGRSAMATLHEYFVKAGAQNLTTHQKWPVTNAEGVKLGELTARLHLDFDANAKYISFFIPEMLDVACPEALALNKVADILGWPETRVGVQAGMGGEMQDARGLVFTGQIYLYSERPVPEELEARLVACNSETGSITGGA
jgi:hypothetical protein